MAPPESKEDQNVKKEQASDSNNNDDRGVAFGTGVAYDDAYGADGGTEYVSELPTMDEERRGELEELDDEGRVSSHPSTMMAASNREVSACISIYYYCIRGSTAHLCVSALCTTVKIFGNVTPNRTRALTFPTHSLQIVVRLG